MWTKIWNDFLYYTQSWHFNVHITWHQNGAYMSLYDECNIFFYLLIFDYLFLFLKVIECYFDDHRYKVAIIAPEHYIALLYFKNKLFYISESSLQPTYNLLWIKNKYFWHLHFQKSIWITEKIYKNFWSYLG